MRLEFWEGMAVDVALHEEGDLWISDVVRSGKPFDPQVVAIMRAFLRPGQTFLDVGANIGIFTLLASKLVGPEGHVVAVEPAPGNLDLLRTSVEGADHGANVRIEACAAGRQGATLMLSLSEDNQGDHRLNAVDPGQREIVPVPVRRVDDLSLPGGPVHLAKFDTQGSETAVLAGMEATFERSPDIRLVTEFWPYGLESCGSSAAELLSALGARFDTFWLLVGVVPPRRIDLSELADMASAGTLRPQVQGFVDLLCLRSADEEGCRLAEELVADWPSVMRRILPA